MPKSFIVDDDYHDTRIDKWFKQKVINLPHSLIERIIRQNKIKLNKKRAKSSHRLQTGDLIEVFDISKFKANNNDKKIKLLEIHNNIISIDTEEDFIEAEKFTND